GPDFRPLQIGKDGNGLFVLDGRSPQHGDVFGMLLMRPVREIQPRHVHPSPQQTVDHLRRTAGRPDGTNYFGMTKTHDYDSRSLSFFTGSMRNSDGPFSLPAMRRSSSLVCYCESLNNLEQHIDTLVERRQRYPFIV